MKLTPESTINAVLDNPVSYGMVQKGAYFTDSSYKLRAYEVNIIKIK